MSESWQAVIAALANDDARAVLGRMMGGSTLEGAIAEEGLGSAKARRVTATLEGAGMLAGPGDARALDEGVFARVLATAARPKAVGVERFLDGDGRIAQYPAGAAERRALLEQVAPRAIDEGETLAEREITERLRAFHEDAATLRRYLVDYGLLERSADGSAYRRGASAARD